MADETPEQGGKTADRLRELGAEALRRTRAGLASASEAAGKAVMDASAEAMARVALAGKKVSNPERVTDMPTYGRVKSGKGRDASVESVQTGVLLNGLKGTDASGKEWYAGVWQATTADGQPKPGREPEFSTGRMLSGAEMDQRVMMHGIRNLPGRARGAG